MNEKKSPVRVSGHAQDLFGCGLLADLAANRTYLVTSEASQPGRAPVRVIQHGSAIAVNSGCRLALPGTLFLIREHFVQPEDPRQQHSEEWNSNEGGLPSRIQDCVVHVNSLRFSVAEMSLL